ncbi:MAG: DUF2165 family protein [Sphingomonadaceae bacterium]
MAATTGPLYLPVLAASLAAAGDIAVIDRILKALISADIGLMALLYVLHNIANLGAACEFFVYTTSHADREAYPVTLLPVPFLIVVAMVLVFALEFAAGLLGLFGGWTMWRARHADAATFERAKKWAKIAMGCAVSLAQVGPVPGIAVAGYQLWQMPMGAGEQRIMDLRRDSDDGAYLYFDA